MGKKFGSKTEQEGGMLGKKAKGVNEKKMTLRHNFQQVLHSAWERL